MSTPIDDPRQLFLHRLRTMLWIELTLAAEVLPELYEHVHASDLKWAVERHMGETERHAKNLREVFELLEEPGDPEPSAASQGLWKEHETLLKAVDADRHVVVDLLHCDSIAHGEHLEIAAYSGLVQTAQALGVPYEAVRLLRENMEGDAHALEQAEHAMVKLLAEQVESS